MTVLRMRSIIDPFPRFIKTRPNNIQGPYLSRLRNFFAQSKGSRAVNTFDPSRGETGSRLNTAKDRFKLTARSSRTKAISPGSKLVQKSRWIIKDPAAASAKLAATPARETTSSPCLILEKFKGLTGTGLAQPKSTLEPERIAIRGKSIVPIGSIWGRGFRVILPALSAVWSPKCLAAKPWATSWTMTEKSKINMEKAINSAMIVSVAF